MPVDSPVNDTLPFPFSDPVINTDPNDENNPNLTLNNPDNITTEVEYDAENDVYIVTEKIGDQYYRPPTYMTFEEYQDYINDKQLKDYWRQRADAESFSSRKPLIPKLDVKNKIFRDIFGDCPIEIKPQGSAELIFGFNRSKVDNPALPENQRRNTTFDFDQKIQMSVTGKIGCNMQLTVNYNTEATFDFENEMKLAYTGEEDDIIQRIEAGNVSLPLSGSLITGSSSLFGVRTDLKFGRLTVSSVFSQQRGKKTSVTTEGGSQIHQYELRADEYDANKHYFLSQDFRDRYDQALRNMPVIESGINITRLEVYVTNKTSSYEQTRNIVAFQDLGEPQILTNGNGLIQSNPSVPVPDNAANNLYASLTDNNINGNLTGAREINTASTTLSSWPSNSNGMVLARDFEVAENMRKLTQSEYSFHPLLGYISLNLSLNSDEVLAVAYQYTLGGETYQVGEFSTDGIVGDDCLYLKMLKSTTTFPREPMWDLMMKNVYAIGAYNVIREDFVLNVLYDNISSGTKINYLPEGPDNVEGVILLRLLNLDDLNNNNDPQPDGFFDYVTGVTINPSNGRIFFPVIEPFGSYLDEQFGADQQTADKYVFQELYDSTKTAAIQFPQKNRFLVQGSYKSESSSEISLNAMNIPQGSVTVTAGGIQLTENVDYTVDYTLGRVRIINQNILNSGQRITASTESQSLFNIQTKTLIGTHLDYRVSNDFNIGATVMNLTERPLTQKVNMGDEPISNTIWGIDGTYRTDSRFLTKMVDRIPFIETKEPSSVTISGEFAHLIPGNARAITREGISYIDDFEGSQTLIDIRTWQAWSLASTPQGQPNLFPEGSYANDLRYGYNRAKLAWYNVDPLFYQNNQLTPDHIANNDVEQKNHYVRQILENELFPNRDQQNPGQINRIQAFDLAYYPRERGPYNYDVEGEPGISKGIDPDGYLNDPETRWAGIMRQIQTTDFEAANIEFIQFWMMDPFIDPDGNGPLQPATSGGDLYFNLGNVSEDILRDSRKAFENGLPTPDNQNPTQTTAWGIVPFVQAILTVFDNDPASREFQDIGLDGLNDAQERAFFDTSSNSLGVNSGAFEYLTRVEAVGQGAYDKAFADPSSDNFLYFRGDSLDNEQVSILGRYKNYGGLEGNSPTSEQSTESFPTSSTTLPNVEDINQDNTVSETESYFQYKISLRPADMQVGQNYIVDKYEAPQQPGTGGPATFYQFKIPVRDPDRVVGGIQDFRSIRFLRMFMKGFSDSVVCRFATMDLVRGEWRRYIFDLLTPGEYIPDDNDDNTVFDISAVNIEENGNREPINYVLPPGLQQETTLAGNSSSLRRLNEQSLALRVCGLKDGDARAAFKNTQFDIRQYRRIEMFVHAEQFGNIPINYGDLTVFMRLGTDYDENYYEYEIPLTFTPWGSKDENEIWPESNKFDFPFQVLLDAKQERNRNGVSFADEYEVADGLNTITVKGNPNLANVKSIMIGVRNPSRHLNPKDDDGLSKCAEVWVNELRLTDFNNNGGWAATSLLQAKLADFGRVSVAATTEQFGWGSIEQKLQERNLNNDYSYDATADLELGKFFPQKSGVKVPMYVGYSEAISIPEFNPLDPDIKLENSLDNLETDGARDTLRKKVQGYERRRGINFVNVTKQSSKQSKLGPMPWSPGNFSLTYAYSDQFRRDIDTEYDFFRSWRGGLSYNWNINSPNVRPFAKLKLMQKISDAILKSKKRKEDEAKTTLDSVRRADKSARVVKEWEEEFEKRKTKKENWAKFSKKFLGSGWWKPVKDFNFYFLPQLVAHRSDLDRQYREVLQRNTSTTADLKIEPNYAKAFTWDRGYDVRFDLTKALKIDFKALNNARIDEPDGHMNRNFDDYEEKKDSLLRNLYNLGRNTRYHHTTNVTYTLPINKFPLFDWINITAQYSADYDWAAAPLIRDANNVLTPHPFGNTIQNANTRQLNGQLNFVNLYNKVPGLKKINRPPRRRPQNNRNKPKTQAPNDSTKQKEPRELKGLKFAGNGILRILMSLRNASFNYSEAEGTALPGYLPGSEYVGGAWGYRSPDGNIVTQAPGWGFLFGSQEDIRTDAVAGRWITSDTNLNNQFIKTYTSNFSGKATLEPFNNFRIELSANRTYARNHSEFFRADPDNPEDIRSFNPINTGNFSMSHITWPTAFISDREDNSSPVFDKFKENRLIIAERLAQEHGGALPGSATEYPGGYSGTSQDVLIRSFLAAYTGQDASTMSLERFPKIPLPNWRITYNGLSKLEFLKKYFKSVTINHGYRSTYNVSTFTTNLNYLEVNGVQPVSNIDSAGNFQPQYTINTVSIAEQFSPLLGIDMTWNNSLLTKFELKKSRNLSLSLINIQLTEVKSTEWVIGAGYRFKNVKFPIRFDRNKKAPVSDLNVRADVSIRDNKTIIRKMIEEIDQATAGQKLTTIKVSADYVLNERFNIRLFYDRVITAPFISSSFPTDNTNAGLSLRFTLAQ